MQFFNDTYSPAATIDRHVTVYVKGCSSPSCWAYRIHTTLRVTSVLHIIAICVVSRFANHTVTYIARNTVTLSDIAFHSTGCIWMTLVGWVTVKVIVVTCTRLWAVRVYICITILKKWEINTGKDKKMNIDKNLRRIITVQYIISLPEFA